MRGCRLAKISNPVLPNKENIIMAKNHVSMPVDYVNVQPARRPVVYQSSSVPKALQIIGMMLGTVGVMTLLNAVYVLATTR